MRYTRAMLQTQKVNELALQAASVLPAGSVIQATSKPGYGSEGEDMLRVQLVIKAAKAAQITGDQVVKAVFELQELLRSAGEERFATIDFATDEELADHGGS